MADTDIGSTLASIVWKIEDLYSRVKQNSVETSLSRDDGWTKDTQTWLYASANSFTITGTTDFSARYPVGSKVRCKQGGAYKYFYVASSIFTAITGPTTVTITGGIDYSLAAGSITDNYYSYQNDPQLFPQWFNWTPTYTGFSISPIGGVRFSIKGRTLNLIVTTNLAGTSNNTFYTMTVPVYHVNNALQYCYGLLPYVMDSGSAQASPGSAYIAPGTNIITLFKDCNSGAWTNSGSKVSNFTFFYEI